VRRNQLGSRRHYYPIRLVFHENAEVVSSGHATPASPRLAPPSMPPGQPRPIRFAAIVAPVIAEALGPQGGPRRRRDAQTALSAPVAAQRPPQAHAALALMRGATRKAARGQS
jgi:hypothetical protein